MAGNVVLACANNSWNCFRICLDKLTIGGLVPISYAALETLKRIKDPVIVIFMVVFFCAVWFLHLYQGVLAHVCVKINLPHQHYLNNITLDGRSHYYNESHWLKTENGFYETCGTHYGSKECPDGYICMEDAGIVSRDPLPPISSYNSISSSYLSILVIAFNDYWEELGQMILLSKGKWNIVTFLLVIFVTYCTVATLQCAALAAFNKVWKSEKKREAKLAINRDHPIVNLQRSSNQANMYIEDGLIQENELSQSSRNAGSNPLSSFCNIFCRWNCCPCCDQCKNAFHKTVFNPFFQFLVVMCLLTEVAILLSDHLDFYFYTVVIYTRLAFDIIYLIEAILKFCALGPCDYFKDGWNIYELFIVAENFVEYTLRQIFNFSFDISVFFKFFRLGRFCPSFQRILQMSNKAFSVQKNFLILLIGFVLFMAFIALESFPTKGDEHYQEAMRIIGYMSLVMTAVRSIGGEWVNGLWACTNKASAWGCVSFYFVVVVVGNLVLINLFTFFLLDGIGKVNKGKTNEEEFGVPVVSTTIQMMSDGADYCIKAWNFVRSRIGLPARYRSSRMQARQQSARLMEAVSTEVLVEDRDPEDGLPEDGSTWIRQENLALQIDGPGPCCPNWFSDCLPCSCYEYLCLNNFRKICYTVAKSTVFDVLTTVIIILSTAFLAIEDIHTKEHPSIGDLVFYSNVLISIVFNLEMAIRIIGLGLGNYFQSAWRFWDFVAVVATTIPCFSELFGMGDLPLLRAVRVIRIFRILNYAWQYDSAREVVNTLTESFPGMINVFAFGLLEWFIFAIMGISLLYGAFGTCVDQEGQDKPYRHTSQIECTSNLNMTWKKTNFNFDNLFESFLSLCQLATIKSWTILAVNGSVHRPQAMYIFFLLFVFFGVYFTYVLWMSTIIDGFNRQREKLEISKGITTSGDRVYYEAVKRISEMKPNKPRTDPVDDLQVTLLRMTEDTKFDACVAILITANLVSLALPHYMQNSEFNMVMIILTSMFIVVYSVETSCRVISWRMDFFDDWFNVLDVICILLTMISVANGNIISHYLFPPTFLRLPRLLKIIQHRRWHLPFTGINIILETLTRAIPLLLSVCYMSFTIVIVYAILGMFLFKDSERSDFNHQDFNFQNFGNSLVVLGQLFTSSGWQSFLVPILNSVSCPLESKDCSYKLWGFFYVTSYLFITYVTMLTLLTVLILQTYSKVRAERQTGISLEEMARNFYNSWNDYDPSMTEYIKVINLSNFISSLQDCTTWNPKTSDYEVAVMDLPIVEGDCVFHRDILAALFIRALFKKGIGISQAQQCIDYRLRPDEYEVVSTTLWRKRENYCASVIQRAWKRYKQ